MAECRRCGYLVGQSQIEKMTTIDAGVCSTLFLKVQAGDVFCWRCLRIVQLRGAANQIAIAIRYLENPDDDVIDEDTAERIAEDYIDEAAAFIEMAFPQFQIRKAEVRP
jgi:hypothetical protein